jgi:hypothetical protein
LGQDSDCASEYLTNGVFDPLKHKSILDLTTYYDNSISSGPIPLLSILRNGGFDVIIVNFPNYTTTNLLNNQMVAINGGAYYIESNAFAFIKLLTETKEKLVQNGSTSQIAVIAPSVAGQITRYALSYMEKNNIPHNVNLWVSVDSPHLGANIPMGDQGLLYRLQSASTAATDFYQKELSSPASQ